MAEAFSETQVIIHEQTDPGIADLASAGRDLAAQPIDVNSPVTIAKGAIQVTPEITVAPNTSCSSHGP
jgi:hypothetical protein